MGMAEWGMKFSGVWKKIEFIRDRAFKDILWELLHTF